MRLKKDSSEQKLRGAYYTPLQLADAMVELFASQNISTVLEPSCGDGVFLDALQNLNLLNKVDKLTAVEIEPDEAEKVLNAFGYKLVRHKGSHKQYQLYCCHYNIFLLKLYWKAYVLRLRHH